jgi:hypothetical protein
MNGLDFDTWKKRNYINGNNKNLNNQFLILFNFVGLDFDIW